jgi:hypothetical protein
MLKEKAAGWSMVSLSANFLMLDEAVPSAGSELIAAN